MVEANTDYCAPNITPKDLASMSEYERRMARAARYGLDASKVLGPQVQSVQNTQLKPDEAFDRMAQGPKAGQVDRIMQKIDKLKARAERFADEEADVQPNPHLKNLESRVSQLRSFEKPEEIQRSATISEDSLYLYGTDFMSTDDIKDYMGV